MTELNRTRLRWSLLTLCAVGVIGAAVAMYLFLGGFDAAADAPWPQAAGWGIHQTMVHSAKLRARDLEPPSPITPAQVQAGFRLYDAHCAMCHGGPGLARQPWTAGMEPSPPYLIDASRRWTSGDLYWIISHGVKMTGMPAWKSRLSSPETWEVVAFLDALPHLTAADYARMRASLPQPGPMPTQPAAMPPNG